MPSPCEEQPVGSTPSRRPQPGPRQPFQLHYPNPKHGPSFSACSACGERLCSTAPSPGLVSPGHVLAHGAGRTFCARQVSGGTAPWYCPPPPSPGSSGFTRSLGYRLVDKSCTSPDPRDLEQSWETEGHGASHRTFCKGSPPPKGHRPGCSPHGGGRTPRAEDGVCSRSRY